jgi:ribose transport system substrate-binding protein
MNASRTRLLASALAICAVALIAAGCGSSKKTTTTHAKTKPTSTQSSSSAAAAADVAYARAEYEKYMAIPKFIPPGPPFDAAKVRGKTIFSIPESTANPFNVAVAQGMAQAAKLLGINFIVYANQGEPSQQVQGMDEAISKHVNLIDLQGGTDPRVLLPQIKQAQAAHIPVVTSHLYDLTQTPVAVNYSIPDNYRLAAKLEADYVIANSDAKANVLILTSNEIVPTSAIVSELKSEFAAHCPACKLTFANVPVVDWATKIEPTVSTALTSDPSINWIIPIYDSMSEWVIPAIESSGHVGKTFISTFNGTPFVMKDLEDGNIVKCEVGEDLGWEGFAYIDAEARILAGLKLPRTIDEHTPLRVFTKANVDQAGVPPKLSTGYGDAYLSGYKKLWGLG